MKKILIAISGMTWLMSSMVYAQAETPVIDQRQMNQEQRIDQGIAGGAAQPTRGRSARSATRSDRSYGKQGES
jgi:opacity protein-like surface antigen